MNRAAEHEAGGKRGEDENGRRFGVSTCKKEGANDRDKANDERMRQGLAVDTCHDDGV